MNIIEKKYNWKGVLSKRKKTTRIILHHAEASRCSPDDIHLWHLNRGWSGIGYHFFVRKDGTIYRGRPESALGSHAKGENYDSIGICAEGSYMKETMPEAQKQAIIELIAYLKDKYGISKVQKHKDVVDTDCPGTNYPFNEIVNGSAKIDNWVERLNAEIKRQGFSTYPIIKKGAKGGITKLIQERLNGVGFNLKQDGIFGNDTEKAVKVFQHNRGLKADGIVGSKTWPYLLSGKSY